MIQDPRYASTLKHPDVEEPIDLWFYRPWGFRLALVGEEFGWSPNFISVMSILLGIGAGLLLYPADLLTNLVGIVLLVLADVCDSADGQLARMTGKFSRLGRILDGASGDVWFIAIYVCICLRFMPEWGWWIWLLGGSAGFCHSKQAALADYYRQFHLFFVKGKSGSELDDSRQVEEEYRQLRYTSAPFYKLFLLVYRNYTRSQETVTPRMQVLRRRLQASAVTDETLYRGFIAGSRPLMKYCNILSFNCRAITLFLSVLAGMPWIYFVVELTLGNALYIYLWHTHEQLCRRYSS